ncbi:MAG TPA: hypothetical protein VMU17_02180 [Elusimicrobiota bacterium]|nr:hypothetical protein [Elusimicrobiota bacterium]
MKRWVSIAILSVIVVPALLFGGWCWTTLHYTYAQGQRAGYVQKISKKGWLCKTWEGELAMANLPGTMPQIFSFSVMDDAVARQIADTVGRRVSLSYDQHRGIPTTCFGDTEFFITHVTMVPEPGSLPAQAAGANVPGAAAAPPH